MTFSIRIPKDFSFENWKELVDNDNILLSIHESESLKKKVYDYAILYINNLRFGSVDFEKGKFNLNIKFSELPAINSELMALAQRVNGDFLIGSVKFDPNKHLPIPSVVINKAKKYFNNHNLDYIRWMAFREEDKTDILKALKLEESKEVNLKDGVDANEIIVTPTCFGWTCIIGDDLPNLLIKGDESSSEEALTNLCKSLQKLSKKFIEVQYFEHQGKSNITGYFKANNGKLNFGYWKSETEEFSKGKVPKEIKKLHPTSAHEVALIWSIDPLDFIYLKEMVEEKSYVVAPI